MWALLRVERCVLHVFQEQVILAHPVQVNPLHVDGPCLRPPPQEDSWWPLHRRVVNTPRGGLPPQAEANRESSAHCSRVSLAGSQSPLLLVGALRGRCWKPGPGAVGLCRGDRERAAEKPGRVGWWLEEGCTGRAPHRLWWNLFSGRPGVRKWNWVMRWEKDDPCNSKVPLFLFYSHHYPL